MKLYLIRHGEAVSEQVDPQRPLTPEGRQDVEKVAGFLKKANVDIGEIYHSSLKRAQETAEIIKGTVQPYAQLIVKDVAPNDDINKILDELSQRKQDLMIVSHLPFLPKLISKLVVNNENAISLATASVLAMYRDRNEQWQIVWLISPELLIKK